MNLLLAGLNPFPKLITDDMALLILAGCLLIFWAAQAIISYYIYQVLKAMPPRYRALDAVHIGLLFVPIFNVIWNFFVFDVLAESLTDFSKAEGHYQNKNCGKTLIMIGCYLFLLASLLFPFIYDADELLDPTSIHLSYLIPTFSVACLSLLISTILLIYFLSKSLSIAKRLQEDHIEYDMEDR